MNFFWGSLTAGWLWNQPVPVMRTVPVWVGFLWVALAAIVAAYPSLEGPFLLDDIPAVVEQPVVQGEAPLAEAWTQTYWGDRKGFEKVAIYRPLVTVSFRINQFLSPGDATAFRWTNVVLHAGVTCLVLVLFRRWFSGALAWGGALLFAVHPVHLDAVAAVANRTELMAALFGLGSFLLIRRKERAQGEWGWWASLGLLAFALLSKESAVIWPLLVGLSFWKEGRVGRRERRWLAFALALTIACLVARGAILADPLGGETPWQDNPLQRSGGVERFGTSVALVGLAAELFLAPFQLSVDYTYNVFPVLSPGMTASFLIGAIVLLVFAGALAWSGMRGKSSIPWIGLWVIALPYGLISNFIFPGTILFAERLLYLPSIGFCGLLVWALTHLSRKTALGLLGLYCAVLLGLSWNYAAAWQSPRTLFEVGLESRPGSARLHTNLGHLALLSRDGQGTVEESLRAIEIDPESPEAWMNLGAGRELLDDREGAYQAFEAASELLDGQFGMAHINRCRMGVVLGKEGTKESCDAGVRLRPDLAAAWVAAGKWFESAQNFAEAEERFRKGCEVESENPLSWHELGGFYTRRGNAMGRLSVLVQLVRLNPRDLALRRAFEAEFIAQQPAPGAPAEAEWRRLQTVYRSLGLPSGFQSLAP